jgi:hypothetical protein
MIGPQYVVYIGSDGERYIGVADSNGYYHEANDSMLLRLVERANQHAEHERANQKAVLGDTP